jgi:hypothetical protein
MNQVKLLKILHQPGAVFSPIDKWRCARSYVKSEIILEK